MSDEKEAQVHATLVALRVPSGLLGFVDALAAREGCTRAEAVRRCLLLERERREACRRQGNGRPQDQAASRLRDEFAALSYSR
jgi:hypothetical protein